jgi:hypothetical protein
MDSRSPEDPSEELERLAEEQISDLESSEQRERSQRGRHRRERVVTLYASGAVQSPKDYYHAAIVMLYGEEVSHFDLAQQLARRAAREGDERAWSVVAAAWDRALLARGQPQRFGTQFVREQGRWTLGEIDEQMTDAERAFYGVPPLWVQRQHLDLMRQRDASSDDA